MIKKLSTVLKIIIINMKNKKKKLMLIQKISYHINIWNTLNFKIQQNQLHLVHSQLIKSNFIKIHVKIDKNMIHIKVAQS